MVTASALAASDGIGWLYGEKARWWPGGDAGSRTWAEALPGAVHHQARLRRQGLDRHEADVRALHCFADGRCVCRDVLAVFAAHALGHDELRDLVRKRPLARSLRRRVQAGVGCFMGTNDAARR